MNGQSSLIFVIVHAKKTSLVPASGSARSSVFV